MNSTTGLQNHEWFDYMLELLRSVESVSRAIDDFSALRFRGRYRRCWMMTAQADFVLKQAHEKPSNQGQRQCMLDVPGDFWK